MRTTLAPNGRGDDQGLVSLALFAQANIEDLTADQGARLEIDVGVSGNLLLVRCEASVEASGFLIVCELRRFLASQSKKAATTRSPQTRSDRLRPGFTRAPIQSAMYSAPPAV